MTTMVLQRQFITGITGEPVAVILPIEEFALVEKFLTHRSPASQADKLAQMEQAARDPLFMADLQETMSDFAQIDAEWWEGNR